MRVFDFRLKMDIKVREKGLNWLDKFLLKVYKESWPGEQIDAFDIALTGTLLALVSPVILYFILWSKYWDYRHNKRLEYWRPKFNKLQEEILRLQQSREGFEWEENHHSGA